jgi:hypothetical protein
VEPEAMTGMVESDAGVVLALVAAIGGCVVLLLSELVAYWARTRGRG